MQLAGHYPSQAEAAAQPNATEQSSIVADSSLQSAISLIHTETLSPSEVSPAIENEQNPDPQIYEDLRIEGELWYSVQEEISLAQEIQLQGLAIQREVEAQMERDIENMNNWSSALDYTDEPPAYDLYDFLEHSDYTYGDDQARE